MKPYYQDPAVTIYHGDCREILPSLGRFDLLLTDPPYGVDFEGKATKWTRPGGGYIGGDHSDGPEVVRTALSVCPRGVVFPGTKLMFHYPEPDDIGGILCPSGAGFGRWGFRCYHPVIFYGKRPSRGMAPSSVVSFETVEDNGHPCPKPLGWMRWAIQLGSLEGDRILDPFAGSGTTGRAAKDLGRSAVLIEREERYCEIAARRMEQEVLPIFATDPPLKNSELLLENVDEMS